MTARTRLRDFGLWAALLALGAQLAFGATLPQPVLATIAFGRLCQAGAAGTAPSRHPTRHVPAGRASVLCAACAMPSPPLAAAPLLPAPQASLHAARAGWRAFPALPETARRTALARGPPSLA